MRNEKLLILESSWADDDQYISDSRSCSRIYRGVEALLSAHDAPIMTVVRPLLNCRFPRDIEEFVSLPCNKKGINVVILAGHGRHELVDRKGRRVHRRTIEAIDAEINISRRIRSISDNLKRTIFVLDSCDIGKGVDSFRKAAGALGVIGFAASVLWSDSVVFVLALLLKFQEQYVFMMKRMSSARPRKVLDDMKSGPYGALMRDLKVEMAFAD